MATEMQLNSALSHVTKFDGSNFQTRKFQIKTVLTAHGVLDIVTGTKLKPTVGENPTEATLKGAAAWEKDNAKAMCIISTSMTYDQLESLTNCVSAKEMWNLLATVHEQKSETNKLIMMQKFYEYKM